MSAVAFAKAEASHERREGKGIHVLRKILDSLPSHRTYRAMLAGNDRQFGKIIVFRNCTEEGVPPSPRAPISGFHQSRIQIPGLTIFSRNSNRLRQNRNHPPTRLLRPSRRNERDSHAKHPVAPTARGAEMQYRW